MNKIIKSVIAAFSGAAAVGIVAYLNGKRREGILEEYDVVRPFSLNKYLGKWYEIARFDYKYERNLENVTAEYLLNEDKSVRVVNSGYDILQSKWKSTVGKAKFASREDTGVLKVSFFGPIWSYYYILEVTDDYKCALVTGDNKNYLWILAREKEISEDIKKQFLDKAIALGFDTNRLYWVVHTDNVQ
ncbi:MAG TPA: lipocalin family protein [Saprospiraceae bacterium]|nr:lipocalin family protein [Saprospiraceae bacterium]